MEEREGEGEERVCKDLGERKEKRRKGYGDDDDDIDGRRKSDETRRLLQDPSSFDHPPLPLPNAERNNSPRGGRGLKSAATESPIIFRSLSFPPNQRIKASLRGPASSRLPLAFLALIRSTKEERSRRLDNDISLPLSLSLSSLLLLLLNTFFLASRKLDCVDPSWTRGFSG